MKEDRDLLMEIDAAVRSITGAKGSHGEIMDRMLGTAGVRPDEAEDHVSAAHRIRYIRCVRRLMRRRTA